MSNPIPLFPRAFATPGIRTLHLLECDPPIHVTDLRREFTSALHHDDIPHLAADDAVSVFTELLTNCRRHCPRSRVLAGAALDPALNSLIGFVSDDDPRMIALPDPTAVPELREHGYGLHLVTHLTTTAQVIPMTLGKCVLFSLALGNTAAPPPPSPLHAVTAVALPETTRP